MLPYYLHLLLQKKNAVKNAQKKMRLNIILLIKSLIDVENAAWIPINIGFITFLNLVLLKLKLNIHVKN